MRVQSHDRFATIAEFDPDSGALVELSRTSADAPRVLEQPLRGHFASLDGLTAVLYRTNGELWLRLGDRAFRLTGTTHAAMWSRSGRTSKLTVVDGDRELAAVEYAPGPETGPPLSEDPTPFVDEEDWDFGLFVHNVASNPERSGLIYPEAADAV